MLDWMKHKLEPRLPGKINNLRYADNSTLMAEREKELKTSWWKWKRWMVLWWPTRPPTTNTKRRCPFHDRGLECKSRKSRDTQSNRHDWPWSAKWSRAKANRVLAWKCSSHIKHSLPTTQETTLHMDITRWSIPKSIDYIFFAAEDGAL